MDQRELSIIFNKLFSEHLVLLGTVLNTADSETYASILKESFRLLLGSQRMNSKKFFEFCAFRVSSRCETLN